MIAGKFAGEESMTPFATEAGSSPSAEKAGFRFGHRGTHSSRTLMLHELTTVLAAAPPSAERARYAAAAIEDNCLEKPTVATRRLSNQRLGELYALDPACAVFRVLRRLWGHDEPGRSLLAVLAALARDPLLAASAEPVLSLPPGAEMQRGPVKEALRKATGDRFNDAVLEKIARNTASSWTQAGHLEGRTFKIRRRVHATPGTVAYALYLGHTAGFRGNELLTSGWVVTLDCTAASARALALEAKRLGLIDLRSAGDLFELSFERLDPGSRRT